MLPNTQSATAAVNYRGVFNHSIYDQTVYLQGRTEHDITDEGLMTHLQEKKRHRLDEVLVNNASRKATQYRAVIEQGTGFWNNFLMPGFGHIPIFNWQGIENSFSTIPKDEAKKKLLELLFEIDLLIDGLNKESIGDAEAIYVKKKRKIKSIEVQNQVETILLSAREQTGVPLELYRQFIQNALKLPNMPLRIQNAALNRITSDAFIRNFHPDLQEKLKLVAKKLIVDSEQPDDCPTNIRSVHYFYGEPGTGKSSAVALILKHLGLPSYTCTIRRTADLSSENLEGTPRTLHAHNPGLLTNTMLTEAPDGKTYMNGALILEDFDRLLYLEGANTSVSAALAFVMEYMDLGKRHFFNPYFNANLNISRLSIFITANRPIPPAPADAQQPDPFKALRSRVMPIHFPDFEEQTLRNICLPHAQAIGEKYGIQRQTITLQKANWVNQAIQSQRQRANALELRDLKREIENIVVRLALA
jgi:hypothetical protein